MTISWTDRHGTSHKFQEDAMELIQQAECLGCQVQSSPSQVGAEQTQDWGGTNWGNCTYLISNKIFKDSNGATTLFLPFCTKQVILLNCSLWKRSAWTNIFLLKANSWKIWECWGLVFSKESLEILTDEFLSKTPFGCTTGPPEWSCRSVSVAVATSCRTMPRPRFVASVGRSGPQALGKCQRRIDAKLI